MASLLTRSKNKRDILKCQFLAIISHLNEILTKDGHKQIKAGKIFKEQAECSQKVASCGKIYLKEHDFFQR